MFYVYEWFNTETNEIFYVGKGTKRRYKVRKHNRMFNEFLKRFPCDSRIVAEFDTEEEAFAYEYLRVEDLKAIDQCVCNIHHGGTGGTVSWWTNEKREEYSKNNVMKSQSHRDRMIRNNPMKDPATVAAVAKTKQRPVVINGEKFDGVNTASKALGVWDITVSRWCKRGYDTNGNPCHYADEEQKSFVQKKTNSKAIFVDDKKFSSVRQAAKYIGVWPENIIRSIKEQRPCKGHVCRYDNQQPSRVNSDNSNTEGSTTNR